MADAMRAGEERAQELRTCVLLAMEAAEAARQRAMETERARIQEEALVEEQNRARNEALRQTEQCSRKRR